MGIFKKSLRISLITRYDENPGSEWILVDPRLVFGPGSCQARLGRSKSMVTSPYVPWGRLGAVLGTPGVIPSVARISIRAEGSKLHHVCASVRAHDIGRARTQKAIKVLGIKISKKYYANLRINLQKKKAWVRKNRSG